MNIRTKLTLTFFSIVIVVLTLITTSIYLLSLNYRETDFYRRLKNRAINTAKLLVEVEEVNADLLRRMERNNPASLPNQYIAIYNYKNEVLYSSETAKPIDIDTTLLNQIRRQSEMRYNEANFEVLGFLFADKDDRLTVIAAATDVYGLDGLRNLRNVLIVIFCISLVFVSILGWIYAGRVLRPISRIVNEVSSITEANLNRRLEEGNRTDELSKLAMTFNSMLQRLQSAFISQKNFIANASHEIKTPITIMSGEIDVALLQPRDNQYYIRVLKSVLAGLKNLNKLSTQLLLLAQTTSDHPEMNFTRLRIDDILWEIKDELSKMHENCVIDILLNMNLSYESLTINGDEQLIRVAILNLMDNGCKYSDNNQVSINIHSPDANLIAVDFINRGKGIDSAIMDKIFSPFYRGKNDKKVRGFGIGLSLVHRIIKLHGGEIAVESIPNRHTRFSITLPVLR